MVIVSHAPKNFRSFIIWPACDGCFACQSVCSLIFSQNQHVQDSTSTGVSDDGCQTMSNISLVFPFPTQSSCIRFRLYMVIYIYIYVTKCTYTCSGPWPFNLFFPVLFLFDWVGVLWPQLSKVLKVVCWAGSIPFPPVSLLRQVVCLLLRPMFTFSSQGRACK